MTRIRKAVKALAKAAKTKAFVTATTSKAKDVVTTTTSKALKAPAREAKTIPRVTAFVTARPRQAPMMVMSLTMMKMEAEQAKIVSLYPPFWVNVIVDDLFLMFVLDIFSGEGLFTATLLLY